MLTSRSSGCAVVLWDNVLDCRKYTLEYARAMGQQLGNLLSRGLGRMEVVCAVFVNFVSLR